MVHTSFAMTKILQLTLLTYKNHLSVRVYLSEFEYGQTNINHKYIYPMLKLVKNTTF